MKNIILIGGGGHCKSCIDVIESTGLYHIKGVLDVSEKLGDTILDYSIIGNDDDIEAFHQKGYCFLITVGQIKSTFLRKKIFEKLEDIGAEIATIISPKATVSNYSTVKKGSIVMHNSFVNAGVKIEENCIINTGVIIEHDVTIGAHTHISTGAIVNGDCKVGSETFIGSATCVSSQIKVGKNCIVGAGSLVIKDITESGIYFGNPAKRKENE
jgi:sugar O-acyltransferase (sialic acid O-acetyltransferase NeuD family)